MSKAPSIRRLRTRRTRLTILIVVLFVVSQVVSAQRNQLDVSDNSGPQSSREDVLADSNVQFELAVDVLEALPVKGRAPKTGYARDEFSDGWARVGECDIRNLVLQRDMEELHIANDGCTVISGRLNDPYGNVPIAFTRGAETSDDVQIDHVVALSDAWQKGAQNLNKQRRFQFANDTLNLLAVDGSLNQQKGGSDAASWLPPNKIFRCRYVARQIAVKRAYDLWVTEAEKAAMSRILNSCKDQPLPIVDE